MRYAVLSVSDMDIIKICAQTLVICIASLILKSIRSEWGAICAISGGVLLLMGVVSSLGESVSALKAIMEIDAFSEYGSLLLKSLGISLATQIGGDICRDVGSATLASKLELAGRVGILALCVPLVKKLVSVAMAVLE
jgi:stage III sporulation protein AD